MNSFRDVVLTLNQHINNATATILGRAQLVESAIQKGDVPDPDSRLATSVQVISNGVETIGAILKDLTNLACFDGSTYTEKTGNLDLESKIRERLQTIEIAETA